MDAGALGSCNCGRIEFRLEIEPTDVYICHCSICRKATGSGGIAVTVVPLDVFSWLGGLEHLRTWQKPQHDWETSFCSTCGSALPGKNDEQSMYVPVSLLDSGAEKLKIKKRLFLDSKAGWEEI